MVQWWRLRVPGTVGSGLILGQGTRSHVPQLKNPICSNEDWRSHMLQIISGTANKQNKKKKKTEQKQEEIPCLGTGNSKAKLPRTIWLKQEPNLATKFLLRSTHKLVRKSDFLTWKSADKPTFTQTPQIAAAYFQRKQKQLPALIKLVLWVGAGRWGVVVGQNQSCLLQSQRRLG